MKSVIQNVRYFVHVVEQQQRCLIFIDYLFSQHNFDNNLFISSEILN